MSTNRKSGKQKPHLVTVRGEWGECESCGQFVPLHPDIGLCGTCTFGEADALMEFEGEWQEEAEGSHDHP